MTCWRATASQDLPPDPRRTDRPGFLRRAFQALSTVAVLGLAACRTTSAPLPADPGAAGWTKAVVARGLANPRGLLVIDERTLWVAEAGRGDPDDPNTGRLLRLRDEDRDGTYETQQILIDAQPSVHIATWLAVNRDEVFGLADLARGGGETLLSLAHPTQGSVIFTLNADGRPDPRERVRTPDNANAIAFARSTGHWYAVQSFANTVLDLDTGQTVAELLPLADGQHAVPAALLYDAEHDAMLVALFSGQRGGDTAGSGIDFVPHSGAIVSVSLASGEVTAVLDGLNAPIDLVWGEHGRVLVLLFCDRFVGPVRDLDAARRGEGHGGFARFSGRLLGVDLASGRREIIASGLDLPTHVVRAGVDIWVTEGQGTPGRTIPGPDGPTRIDGRITKISPLTRPASRSRSPSR